MPPRRLRFIVIIVAAISIALLHFIVLRRTLVPAHKWKVTTTTILPYRYIFRRDHCDIQQSGTAAWHERSSEKIRSHDVITENNSHLRAVKWKFSDASAATRPREMQRHTRERIAADFIISQKKHFGMPLKNWIIAFAALLVTIAVCCDCFACCCCCGCRSCWDRIQKDSHNNNDHQHHSDEISVDFSEPSATKPMTAVTPTTAPEIPVKQPEVLPTIREEPAHAAVWWDSS